jgi:hypothetical protein
MDGLSGRYLAQRPKRATQTETLRQSSRSFWSPDYFRGALLDTMSFFQGDSWDNLVGTLL